MHLHCHRINALIYLYYMVIEPQILYDLMFQGIGISLEDSENPFVSCILVALSPWWIGNVMYDQMHICLWMLVLILIPMYAKVKLLERQINKSQCYILIKLPFSAIMGAKAWEILNDIGDLLLNLPFLVLAEGWTWKVTKMSSC